MSKRKAPPKIAPAPIAPESPLARIDWAKPGRVLSASKQAPEGHVCVWNAKVVVLTFVRETRSNVAEVIWYGDLDLTADRDELRLPASARATTLYICAPELVPGKKTDHTKAVAIFRAAGSYEIFGR